MAFIKDRWSCFEPSMITFTGKAGSLVVRISTNIENGRPIESFEELERYPRSQRPFDDSEVKLVKAY